MMYRSWRWIILVRLLLSSIVSARGRALRSQHFDYDEDLAKISVIYSSATYQRVSNWTFINPECNERTKGFILNQTYVGNGTDAFGYVGLDTVGKRIVVAFKGTSDYHDWITDLRTWLRYRTRCAPAALMNTDTFSAAAAAAAPSSPLPPASSDRKGNLRRAPAGPTGPDELIGNVHFGFCDYYQTLVAKGVADRIALLARELPDYNVFVTGHSLGAAAAAVCAVDMTQRMLIERDRVMLYTLGEPRTGDGIFAEGLNDHVGTSYRVVHNRDVVPHLSLCCHGWFGKCRAAVSTCPYQHSSEIVYANDMSPGKPWVVCNDTVGEDYACDPQDWDLSVWDHKHYFNNLVGEFCAIPPSPAPEMRSAPQTDEALPEGVRWASKDAAMRRDEAPFRWRAGGGEGRRGDGLTTGRLADD